MSFKIYLQKLTRRILYVGCKIIPYNTSLRPIGFYSAINGKDGLAQAENINYIEVFKGYQSDLNNQDPFYNLCTEGLAPQSIAYVPASFIVEIPKGRLQQNILGTSIAVISESNKLIGEISYQYDRPNVELPIQAFDIFKQKYFTKPVKYKGVVFSMLSGSVASTNYFHWLYDCLPRLYLLKESGLFNKVDFFLVPRLQQRYHRETLKTFGIKQGQIIECDRYTHIEADTLIISSHVRHRGQIPAWACKYHNKTFVKNTDDTHKEETPYVYIRRGDSKIRQISNEAKLMKLLEGFGFKSFLLSELPYAKQVELFSSAKIILAAHGAGLANLSFCKERTTIIELFAQEYIKPTYQIISKRMGLNYKYIICQSDAHNKPKTIRQAIDTNITVDLSQISKVLSGIILSENRYNEDLEEVLQ